MIFCACSPAGTAPAPNTTFETPFTIAYPGATAELSIVSDLPGMLRLVGYSGSDFVNGTVQVSNRDWTPKIEIKDGKVSLVQAKIKAADSQNSTNLWKLRVSDNQSFRLDIRNSQAEGHWNFSGLPITDLYAELGTAKNAFTFDEPNPTIMRQCELRCSTGDVILEGILNAACQNMVIKALKGSLTLRFGEKEILQNLKVTIEGGAGTINISVPGDVPARVTVTGKNQVNPGDGISKVESKGSVNTYETAIYPETPSKAIEISILGGSGIIYLNPLP